MIDLFNIENYTIDTSQFSNLLHDSIIKDFEDEFADYVGVKYACGVCSATVAIEIVTGYLRHPVQVPSIIPPVVLNALNHAKVFYSFVDNIEWVGNSYKLINSSVRSVIDSAQRVEKNQYKKEAKNNDIIIYSFYPTKPVGSIDGGMVVSDDLEFMTWFRQAVHNGMELNHSSWLNQIGFPGWKAYLNSIQAFIAQKNFRKLEDNKLILNEIRELYNELLGYNNTSDHLYRIKVQDNKTFIDKAKEKGITCGIHYKAMHKNTIYKKYQQQSLPLSELIENQTVSLPFHVKLNRKNIEYICETVNELCGK